eukprot:10310186-Heterocapsa_arctica.AAC.1
MLKYWPNRGVVLVKTTEEAPKRKWNEMDNRYPEKDKKPQGWGKGAEQGGNNSYENASGWRGDTWGSPAKPTTRDAAWK